MKAFFITLCICLSSLSWSQESEQTNYFLAESYFRQGEFDKAAQIYNQLYKKSPFNTTYLKRLLTCYQEENDFEKAENLLKNKMIKEPRNTFLAIFLGYNFGKQGLEDQAKSYYQQAINSLEIQPNYGGIMGRIFKDYGLLTYAIIAYKKAMEKNKNTNYDFQIAQIYGEQGEFKLMFDAYVDLVDKNGTYLNLVQRYASRYISEDPNDAVNILFKKSLLRKSINNAKNEWNILLSWLFTQQKEYNKALIQEKALFQRKFNEVTEIFDLGKIAFDDKDYMAAEDCFSFVDEHTQDDEEKIYANLYLSKILVATDDENATSFFQSLFEKFGINPFTIPIQVDYADYLTFNKNNPVEATEVLEKALSLSQTKFQEARIKLKLGDVLVYREKYNKALIYFSQIQTKLKNHVLAQEARFKVAQTSYFRGDFEWAKAQLKVLKGATTQLIANDAVDLFLKITDNEPVDSIPTGLKQLAKAELYAYQNRDVEALEVVENIFNNETLNVIPGEVIYDDLLYFQSKVLLKQKRFDEAILSLSKIIAADNQGFLADDVIFTMANIYREHLLDDEKAKEYYQKIIFDYPSSIYLVEARKQFRKLRGDNIN